MQITFNIEPKSKEVETFSWKELKPQVFYYMSKYDNTPEKEPKDVDYYYIKLGEVLYRVTTGSFNVIHTGNLYETDRFKVLPKEFTVTLGN